MMSEALTVRTAAFCRRWEIRSVLCAVSGGRDSMALLHILCHLSAETGLRVSAAHFNHCLRRTADRDELFVRDWCRAHGVPFYAGRGDVRAQAARSGTGIEDAARTLRYQFLEETASAVSAQHIATAHHRGDNAETVLLHLLRGTGPQGLSGIPPVRGRIVRPLLETGRDEIDAYIAENRIPYVEDETNRDPAYIRNRVRSEVLPLLEQISPGSTVRIAAAAALLRDEDAHLQAEADALLPEPEDGCIMLPVPVLKGQDIAMQRRLVRTMARRLGVTPTVRQTEAALSLTSGKIYHLPGGLEAVRLPHRLILRRLPDLPPPQLLHTGVQYWGPWQITLGTEPAGPDALVLDAAAGPLTVAAWDGTGRLAVENGSRSLKRIFQDCGIAPEKRREHPVLYADGKPAAAPGAGVDWTLRPKKNKPVITVTFAPATGKET
ncbi:MAG: tRNA lysidine(34) synthetase TilS [Oscillospiraceae bacterium]|nr:tRNA lysidine(34) synthetase TilS [Oscillospiraceae bacterium]